MHRRRFRLRSPLFRLVTAAFQPSGGGPNRHSSAGSSIVTRRLAVSRVGVVGDHSGAPVTVNSHRASTLRNLVVRQGPWPWLSNIQCCSSCRNSRHRVRRMTISIQLVYRWDRCALTNATPPQLVSSRSTFLPSPIPFQAPHRPAAASLCDCSSVSRPDLDCIFFCLETF